MIAVNVNVVTQNVQIMDVTGRSFESMISFATWGRLVGTQFCVGALEVMALWYGLPEQKARLQYGLMHGCIPMKADPSCPPPANTIDEVQHLVTISTLNRIPTHLDRCCIAR